MQNRTLSYGVEELSSRHSPKPYAFSPNGANYPAHIEPLIEGAQVFATNVLFGYELAPNAQILWQINNGEMAKWQQKVLSFIWAMLQRVKPEVVVGEKPSILAVLELLKKEEEKQGPGSLPSVSDLAGYRIIFYVNDHTFDAAAAILKVFRSFVNDTCITDTCIKKTLSTHTHTQHTHSKKHTHKRCSTR